jgi:hypothetical protein
MRGGVLTGSYGGGDSTGRERGRRARARHELRAYPVVCAHADTVKAASSWCWRVGAFQGRKLESQARAHAQLARVDVQVDCAICASVLARAWARVRL